MSFVQMTSTNIYELHDVEPSLTAGFIHRVVSMGDSENRPSTLPAALARESKCHLHVQLFRERDKILKVARSIAPPSCIARLNH